MARMACAICGRKVDELDPTGRCSDCSALARNLGTAPPTDSVHYVERGRPAPRVKPELDPLIGRELGGCRIISKIGGGGMGVVYRAEQLSLGRTVAIKLVRTRTEGDEQFIARLRSEARVIASLNHPHILHVHDIGAEQELHYIVMEFVDGPSLRPMIRQGLQDDTPRCRELFIQCLQGLGHAHSRGVIHRDLKPDNILIAPGDQVKLADFGLAKALVADQGLTASGIVMGTPLYMSPESARGETLDSRADIYSLGATFYHVLAGAPPFSAETPIGILYRQIHDPLPPLRDVRPDVDPGLAAIVERMLAKSKADRFGSCDAVLTALGVAPSSTGASRARSSAQTARDAGEKASQAPPLIGTITAPLVSVTASRVRSEAPTFGSTPPGRGRPFVFWALAVMVLLALGAGGRRAIQQWRQNQVEASATATPVPWPTVAAPLPPTPRPSPPALVRPEPESASQPTSIVEAGVTPLADSTPSSPATPTVISLVSTEPSGVPPSSLSDSERALWKRCDEFLRHLVRGEVMQLWRFTPRRDSSAAARANLLARIRRALRMPSLEKLEAYEILRVQVDSRGENGRTDIALLMRPGEPVTRQELSLRWKLEDGEWRLAAKGE